MSQRADDVDNFEEMAEMHQASPLTEREQKIAGMYLYSMICQDEDDDFSECLSDAGKELYSLLRPDD